VAHKARQSSRKGNISPAGVVSSFRQSARFAFRLRLARKPKWRMRGNRGGSTCVRKRRINSSAWSVICLNLFRMAIVLPMEGDLILVHSDEPLIGNGHAMGVAAEIGQRLSRAAERRFGIDHPFGLAQRFQVGGEGFWLPQMCQLAEPLPTGLDRKASFRAWRNKRRNRRESTRTGRKNPGLQAIQRCRSGERPPPGTTQCRCG